MAKRRTKAERRAAALKAWERRRANSKVKQHVEKPNAEPDKSQALSSLERLNMLAPPDILAASRTAAQAIANDHLTDTGALAIPAIVKEGGSLYLQTLHSDGSHSRNRISISGAKKLFKELSAILL